MYDNIYIFFDYEWWFGKQKKKKTHIKYEIYSHLVYSFIIVYIIVFFVVYS